MQEDSFYQSEITDMHEMYMHVNRVDLRIKALIALEVDDPEDFFFYIMTPHYIPKSWCPARVAQW